MKKEKERKEKTGAFKALYTSSVILNFERVRILRRKIEKKFEIEGRSSMIRDCSGVLEEKERKSGRSIYWAVVKLFIKYFSSFKISLKILRIFFFFKFSLKNFYIIVSFYFMKRKVKIT